MVKRILLVEDDREIAEIVKLHLGDHGFEVMHAANGVDALALLKTGAPDMVVLDLMLPDIAGLELCRRIRAGDGYLPVLMLTARSSETDRVLGLELGADDYLTKPFGPRELVARVKALFRRIESLGGDGQAQGGKVLSIYGVEMDPSTRKVTVAGRAVELTATEFDLLHHLASHPGRVYTRGELLQSVWGYGHEGYEHTVNSHINRLRSKIEDDPAKPRYVRTVWGVGYKFPDSEDIRAGEAG